MGHRVLFIDDDEALLKSVGAYLEKSGYEVHLARTGEEGLRLWAKHRPEVTICDLRMPGMSGMDVLAGLRADRAVVLMLTGTDQTDAAVEAMRLGAENFLTKPIEMPHLVQAVEKAAEKATLHRETVRLKAMVPSKQARLAQVGIAVVLIVLAIIAGQVIGRGQREIEPAPIPIPIDTVP